MVLRLVNTTGMDSTDELKNIIGQIENTSYYINSNSKGHFVSEGQLALIKKHLGITDSNIGFAAKADKDRLALDALLEERNGHSQYRDVLKSRFAAETDGASRKRLNENIQFKDSAIAKLNRQIRKYLE